MALKKITQVTGRGVPVPGDDIDTDRIIPARFMKCVTFDGLGDYVFHDVRKNEDGTVRAHPLNEERFAGASILISGNNFGCGSSREHAPQAIYRAGFRAVIAEGFAEIFFGNSTQLGMPCVTAGSDDLDTLRAAVDADPRTEITIDLLGREIRFAGRSIPCGIREGARKALLDGRWDPLQDLLEGADAVAAVAGTLPYMTATGE
ncbi:MAG: 3-isopropylmalate dehydratase small subunit [Oceanipulchritudo sp.]